MTHDPNKLKYTETHEWVAMDGDIATVGITDHAQEQLGDVVYVGLPEVGSKYSQGDTTATVESVKAASDIYAPLPGEITEINEGLNDSPENINSAPYGDGWLFKIKVSQAESDKLVSAEEYEKMI